MTKEALFEKDFFYSSEEERQAFLVDELVQLTEDHQRDCPDYASILKSIHYSSEKVKSVEDIPFLPVRIFKEYELKSISDEDVFKVMRSSGTTGQQPSKIFLDKETSSLQTKALSRIINCFIGKKRLPMIIIDCPSVLKDRANFSARGAGILGFSIFGRDRIYALNDDMTVNVEALVEFLEKYEGQKILLFGFTYIIWQHFLKECKKLNIDLSRGILFHGGGWKKLIAEQVSEAEFKNTLNENFGLEKVYNYYGMVEQTGSIFVECEEGYMHPSILSDVIVRSPHDLSVLAPGQRGILQVLSVLPHSYPGHSLLTEDEGEILGHGDCKCGRSGSYFKIYGRIQNAEIRGCSDTYE